MRLLTTCCFTLSLRSGTIILFVLYWWLSVTYVVLLLNYFYEHTVTVSLLIGLIFLIWVACSTAGLYGDYKRNPYYLIPQIISDILDCIQILINLIHVVITGDIFIPRYTTFGANWRIEDAPNKKSISTTLYNLFDERYPLPTPIAIIDLIIRIYFVLVLLSCFQEFKDRRKKKENKKTMKKKTTPPVLI